MSKSSIQLPQQIENPLHEPRSAFFVTVVALGLTSCLNGENDESDAVTPSPPSSISLGRRAMPGITCAVDADTPIVAGKAFNVLISVSSQSTVATVTAAVGSSFETTTAAVMTPISANRWRASMTLPDPLPTGTCVLVSLTLTDGSVIESGLEDFLLTLP